MTGGARMSKYTKYESAKRELGKKNLPPQEYEKAIREICRKLKI